MKKIKATTKKLKNTILEKALEMGFNSVGFTSAEALIESEKNMLAWREKGLAGDMDYLLRENPINARPEELLKGAKTIIAFTINYFTEAPPRPSPKHRRVAAYAVGLDYHKVIKKKLKQLVKNIEAEYEERGEESPFKNSRIFTDAVPLLEKSFARKAGLGFKGKNTMLISKKNGSFNFIAEILTDIEIEPDPEISIHNEGNTCGTCTKCIDICPTDALIGDHQIDARKCISYLTIENKGPIEDKYAKDIGEWLYGCDLCQTICPYNSKVIETPWEEFKAESGVGHWLNTNEILSMTEEEFHEKFCRTPITRAKLKGLQRNALINTH